MSCTDVLGLICFEFEKKTSCSHFSSLVKSYVTSFWPRLSLFAQLINLVRMWWIFAKSWYNIAVQYICQDLIYHWYLDLFKYICQNFIKYICQDLVKHFLTQDLIYLFWQVNLPLFDQRFCKDLTKGFCRTSSWSFDFFLSAFDLDT